MALFGNGRRENTFIRLLRSQAEVLQRGAVALERFVSEGDDEAAEIVELSEKEGDELRRILIIGVFTLMERGVVD